MRRFLPLLNVQILKKISTILKMSTKTSKWLNKKKIKINKQINEKNNNNKTKKISIFKINFKYNGLVIFICINYFINIILSKFISRIKGFTKTFKNITEFKKSIRGAHY